MPTQLEILAEQYRREHLTKNTYVDKNEYSSNHPNAMSDGDEKGKNEIGSSVDIQNRINNLVKNTYSEDNGYGSNHPNAMSDGDEKWNIPNHIRSIVETFDLYNPTDSGNITSDIEFLPENIISELIEKSGIKDPLRTVPKLSELNASDNKFGSNIKTSTITAEDASNIPSSERNNSNTSVIGTSRDSSGQIEVLNNNSGVINLECGTIEGIISKIGDI